MRLHRAIDPISGLSSVSVNGWDIVDNAIAKNVTLNSICCGTLNNVAYNFKADTWALIGRAPYTLANVPAICEGVDAPGYPSAVTSLVATTSTATASTSATISATLSASAASTSATATASTSSAHVDHAITSSAASLLAATFLAFLCLCVALCV